MQSFRFRVWDHEYGTMIRPSDVWISFVFLEGRTEPDAYIFDWKKKQWKPIPLRHVMQSIPHPKGDGMELFEGDIVIVRGRFAVVDTLRRYGNIDRCAVPRPEILSDPRTRVLVVGNNGKSPGRDLERAVRERWQVQCN